MSYPYKCSLSQAVLGEKGIPECVPAGVTLPRSWPICMAKHPGMLLQGAWAGLCFSLKEIQVLTLRC